MSMVCPECHGSFDQTLQCPTCNVRLQYRSGGRSAGAAPAAGQGQWQNTPWGRIVVGILLSQGLGHGLQMLCTAGVLAASEEAHVRAFATTWQERLSVTYRRRTDNAGFKAGNIAGEWSVYVAPELPPSFPTKLHKRLDRDFPVSRPANSGGYAAEAAHYRMVTLPIPKDVILEVGGLAVRLCRQPRPPTPVTPSSMRGMFPPY